MKTDEKHAATEDHLEIAVLQLMHTAMTAECLHLVSGGSATEPLRPGYHSHAAWEIFCPLQGSLTFETLGDPQPVRYPQSTLLIVPPHTLHMSVDRLPQSRHLQLLTMNLPGDQIPYGTLCVRGPNSDLRSALSAAELSRWTEMLGAGPGQIMEKAAAAMSAGDWGRERALAYLRLVFSSYPEIACNRGNMRQYHSHRAVTETLALLQTRYFDSSLTVPLIAARIGVSASHLAALFRQTTGQTIHQMLIDIRMRRATELLSRTQYSIKKIAELTGWHNQLYFSAAYRRRHGKPPSAARSA